MYLRLLILAALALENGTAAAEPIWRAERDAFGSRAAGTYLGEFDPAFNCANGQAVIGTSMSLPGNIYVAIKDEHIIQHLSSIPPLTKSIVRKDDLQNTYTSLSLAGFSTWRMERRTDNFYIENISPERGLKVSAKKEGSGLLVEVRSFNTEQSANWYFNDCRYIFNDPQPYPDTVYPGATMYDKYEVIARCDSQAGPGRLEAQRNNVHQAGEIVIGVDPEERRNVALIFKPYVAENSSFGNSFIQRFVGWPRLPTVEGTTGMVLSTKTWTALLNANEEIFSQNQFFQAKGSQVRKTFPTNTDEELVVEFFRDEKARLLVTNLQGDHIANWQFGTCEIVN